MPGQSLPSALLVLEKEDSTLAILDPATLKVVARVPAGPDPHEVAASADGKLAFITNYGAFGQPQHTLSIVNLATHRPESRIDLVGLLAPHGIQFAGGKVYFTAEGSKALGRYDPATKQVDWVLGLGQNRTHMLVVSPDERRIFTSNVNSDTVSLLRRDQKADASGWTQSVVAVGKGPEGFDVSPDGKELWAANSGDGTISVVDIGALKVIQRVDVQTKRSNRLKFTPDGRKVLISDLGNGDLVVMDAASRKPIKRISIGQSAAGILIEPGGKRALVADPRDNFLAIVDLNTLTVTQKIPTGKGPDGMTWVGPAPR